MSGEEPGRIKPGGTVLGVALAGPDQMYLLPQLGDTALPFCLRLLQVLSRQLPSRLVEDHGEVKLLFLGQAASHVKGHRVKAQAVIGDNLEPMAAVDDVVVLVDDNSSLDLALAKNGAA